jgi:hypothetical protein
MMKGVTLLEFLVSTSLFVLLLIFSYHTFDSQRRLLNQMESQTKPEEESNYRMLLVKHFLEKCSSKLKVDPFLEAAPVFFPDLSFGQNPQKNSFSVAYITGVPIRFQRAGGNYQVRANVAAKKVYLLAGSDGAGNYCWNYSLVEQIWVTSEGLTVQLKNLSSTPEVERGTLIEVEVHGFLFQNRTLYWISPGGAAQPFIASIDSFEYSWSNPALTMLWKKSAIQMEFRCAL